MEDVPRMNKYQCNTCNWSGSEEELDFDATETCFGDDKIEVCPKCGSMDIHRIQPSKPIEN